MLCHGGSTKSNAVNERVNRTRVWHTTGIEPKARSIAKNPHQIIGASVGFRGERPIPVLRGDDRQCPQYPTNVFIIHERRIVGYFANKADIFGCIQRSFFIEESR
ncbi:hypothetical protein D3C78_604070 [compost metagenome]